MLVKLNSPLSDSLATGQSRVRAELREPWFPTPNSAAGGHTEHISMLSLDLWPRRGRTWPLFTSTVRALSKTSALGEGCEASCAGGIEVLPLPGTSWREQEYSAASPRSRHCAAPGGHAALAQSTSATYRGAPRSGLGAPKPSIPLSTLLLISLKFPRLHRPGCTAQRLGLARQQGQPRH